MKKIMKRLLISAISAASALGILSLVSMNVSANHIRPSQSIQGYWQHNTKVCIRNHPMDELLPGHTYTNYDELHIYSDKMNHYQKPAGQGSISQRYKIRALPQTKQRSFLATNANTFATLKLVKPNKLDTMGLPPKYSQTYYRIQRRRHLRYGVRDGNRIAKRHAQQYRQWKNRMNKTINNDNRKKMQHVPVSVVRVFDNKMATANHKLNAHANTHIPAINTKGQYEYVPKVGSLIRFQFLGDSYGELRRIIYRHKNHFKNLLVLSRKTVSELEAAPVNYLLNKIVNGLKPIKNISKWICTSKHLGKFGKRAARSVLGQSVGEVIDLLSVSHLTAKSMSYPYYSVNRLLTPTMQRPTYSRIG